MLLSAGKDHRSSSKHAAFNSPKALYYLAAKASPLLALAFLRELLAFERGSSLLKRLLVAAEPSLPPVILRADATPDKTLRGLAKVELVAQDRLCIA
jgi:hypothetical protein